MTRPVQKLVRPATLRSRWSLLLVLLVLLAILSLLAGRFPIDWRLLFPGRAMPDGLPADGQTAMARSVLFNLRLPRTFVALYGGFCLALVGSILQTIFKNPLASPDIMGVSSGASVGAAAAILFLGSGVLPVTLGAFAGGLLAVTLAIFLAQSGNQRQLATFVVSGLAVNALAQALLMLLKLVADPHNTLAAIEFWIMGGLGTITLAKAGGLLAATLPALILLILLNRQVSLLSLSDSEAMALGVNLHLVRPLLLGLATLVVAGTVAVTGLISFIGLIAPHIARLVYRRNDRTVWLFGGLVGSGLLLTADILARSLATAEIPVSILTSLIGVPVLVSLVHRGGRLP